MPPSTTTARRQCNVRLPPTVIEAADARRATLGLSRDRYIEQLIEADTQTTTPPAPDPAPETTLDAEAEAALLLAQIRGDHPV